MASKMGYYNVEEFMKQKRQQEKHIKIPPKANFLAAIDHIRKLFEGKKFTYAIMGGLEMLCLGYRREMPDLQIAYDDKDFHKIKSKLEHDQRIRLPEGMNSLFPAKILVRTGPAYKDEGCTQSGDIEVDLVPPGSHGTPPNGNLTSNLVLLSLKTEGKLKSYKGLNMLYLVKSLVHYCRVRDLAWDPRKDILFLCQHYAGEVQSVRAQLDQKAVQQNFLGTSFLSRLPQEDQRRCYHVLLGTEPPPVMAITPPPSLSSHKHSASDSDASAKPRLSSHQSSPSLNTPNTSALLSPPLPAKPRLSRQNDVPANTHVVELPTSSNVQMTPTELSTAAREPRSRYRQVHAPGSREISPVEVQGSPAKVVHIRQRSQPPPTTPHPHATHGIYQSRGHQLQPPARYGRAMMATLGSGFTQTMHVQDTGAIPPYEFAQTPSLNQSGPELGKQSQRVLVEMSVMPTTIHMSPHYMNPTVNPAQAPSRNHNQIMKNADNDHTVPVRVRTTHQTQGTAQTNVSDMSKEPRRMNRFYVVNPEESKQDHSRSDSALGIQSEQTPSPPVELDAVSQLGQFIAELSADRTTPAPDQAANHESYDISIIDAYHQSPSAARPMPLLKDSPVSPEDSNITPTAPQEQTQYLPIRPLNPRTYSAPAAALPASLTAGGSTSHQRSSSHASTAALTQSNLTNTNASKYTRYYSSQTPPSSIQPTLKPPPSSIYKAYQPTLSPPILDPDTPTEGQSPYTALKDVDGAREYFKHHKRDASLNSQTSRKSDKSARSDSRELAMEYQAELPGFDSGYGI